jgi:DNA processing protein
MTIDPYIVALCSIPSLGPVTQRRLLSAMGTAEAVFGASGKALREVEGMTPKRVEAVRSFSDFVRTARETEALERDGIRIVADGGEGFPGWIRILGDETPLILFIRGEISEDDRFAVAIVGSRTATEYGKITTERIASELSEVGITVVSGLARGIDTMAHRGAVALQGRTIGVLGSGIDVPYPPENRGLMDRIAHTGAVISEFAPGTQPMPANFPRRNRLISALSLGVVVVEAAKRSGSLITARHALEQGREVFAVPGNVSSNASQGTNELLKQGARLVTGASDILEELAPQLKDFLTQRKKKEIPVTADERVLCDIMSPEPRHIDEILRSSGMPTPKAMSLLLALELKGVVKQTEGKRFYLV